MNNWNFNELTQQDILDFKACKHDKTGQIYGIKDSSTCQSGKELSDADINKLAVAANKGDVKAKKQLAELQKVRKTQKDEARAEKQKKDAEEKKKKAEAGDKKKGKGKKGGGKGKKGGGKGKKGGAAKGGKGKGKGGGAAKAKPTQPARQAQQKRKEAVKTKQQQFRKRLADLQKALRKVENPEVRKVLEQQIADAMKSVSELPKAEANQPATTSKPTEEKGKN